jgi:tRNA nucleotidyltransferase (CCA-adding enzyme)
LGRLRYPNDTRARVTEIVRHHLVVYDSNWTDAAMRRWLKRVSVELWRDIVALAHADVRGKGREVADEIERLHQLTRHAERIIAEGAALRIRDLSIGGADLMSTLGITPGPLVGKLLRLLLEDVIEHPEDNQRERLLDRAKELLASHQSEG